MGSLSAWPSAAGAKRPRARRALAAGLGLGAAFAAMLALPETTFRAEAIVSITDPVSPLALFLPKMAAEMAVSKPVIRRAAESLIETGSKAPEPSLFERVALVARVDGAQATGKTARVAEMVGQIIAARPGALPGSLEVSATDPDADRAAHVASAVADALIAEQDDVVLRNRRSREVEIAGRVERLRREATAARGRLAALGGVEADPAQLRASSAAQTASAQARVDTIHAILASGSPPLSDRRDVPAAIEALQTTYLDLSRQLAKARETLGERHTTIISLLAEVKHAAANLTAEWRRLSKLAEGELTASRQREASLRKADSPADASRRAAIDEARRAVKAADDAVAQAQAGTGEAASDDRGYRLLLRPVIPSVPSGLSTLMRLIVSAVIGGLAVFVALVFPKFNFRSLTFRRQLDDVADTMQRDVEASRDETASANSLQPEIASKPAPSIQNAAKLEDTEALMHAMFDLITELQAISPAFGPVPTIMVTATEAGMQTTPVALALGRAVAQHERRALLVEVDRVDAGLAAAAGEDDPILVDLYGTLRVALRAETEEGMLYLAPSLKQGNRIAAALARGNETPIVDDIGAEFDLVIIDGGEAAACAAEGWGADLFLRVGRFESRRDDAMLAETFDVPGDMVVGTVVASKLRRPRTSSVPPPARPVARPASKPVVQPMARARSLSQPAPADRRRVGRR